MVNSRKLALIPVAASIVLVAALVVRHAHGRWLAVGAVLWLDMARIVRGQAPPFG